MTELKNKKTESFLLFVFAIRWSEDTDGNDMPGFNFSKLWQYDSEKPGFDING